MSTQKKQEEIVIEDITYQNLISKNAFYGYSCDTWDPRTAPFILSTKTSRQRKRKGQSNHTYLIDLGLTIKSWNRASEAIVNVAARGGTFLIVGSNPMPKTSQLKKLTNKAKKMHELWDNYADLIKRCAETVNVNYVNGNWKGGILTNFPVIRQSIERYKKLEDFISKVEDPNHDSIKIQKKELTHLKKELKKLKKQFGGLVSMEKLPDMLIVFNMNLNSTAVFEAKKLGIPVVCVGNTIANPELAEYFIPANDNSIDTLTLFLTNSCASIELGKQEYKNHVEYIQQLEQEIEAEEETPGLSISIVATDIPVTYKNKSS